METPLLKVDNLGIVFGGLVALHDVEFTLRPGIIKTVIGPNGAGKSTLLNIITGQFPPTSGTIEFQGRPIQGLESYKIARLGISRTFQHVETFTGMTVLENVMVGRYPRTKASFFASGLKLPWVRKEEAQAEKDSREILSMIGLADRADEDAGQLALGEQKILEIGHALATNPTIICLDEPAAGLNETDTLRVSRIIQKIRERGTTVILIEHDLKLVMSISDEILVLNYGEKIAEGTPHEIQNNPLVIEAYLGGDFHDAAS